jgi:hypothetical protein
VESPKRCREAGWLHRLSDGARRRGGPRIRRVKLDLGYDRSTDFAALADSYRGYVDADMLQRFARGLGLRAETPGRFGLGWSPGHTAWSFPMRAGDGAVVGIHLREPDGSKLCVKGSRLGLFIPDGAEGGDRLLIAEGLSDAMALVETGFPFVIGRPSCSAGDKHAVELIRRAQPSAVILIADGDEAGRRGAGNLASALVCSVPEVRVIVPPDGIKDVREWYGGGGTQADVEQAIDAASPRRLQVRRQGAPANPPVRREQR